MPLILRNTKGSQLTFEEMDGNFTYLETLDQEKLTTSSFNNFTASYTTGSFTGSFKGDGSQLTGLPSSGGEPPVYKYTGSLNTSIVPLSGSNISSGDFSTVGGGINNQANGVQSFIGGGDGNIVNSNATIAGGLFNFLNGNGSFIGGGGINQINDGIQSFIGAGDNNIIESDNSGILGGMYNTIRIEDSNSFILGSFITSNAANTTFVNNLNVSGSILGFGNASLTGSFTGSFKGDGSQLTGLPSSGGEPPVYKYTGSLNTSIVPLSGSNTESSHFSVIGGGSENSIFAMGENQGGGIIFGGHSVIAGGQNNEASASFSFIGGGIGNRVTGFISTVGGGDSNNASGAASTIGGGSSNYVNGQLGTVAGGSFNGASGYESVVAGGGGNTATGAGSIIGGGEGNATIGIYSTIGGGLLNTARALNSGILGGESNIVRVQDNDSFIIGSNITTNASNTTFVNQLNITQIPTSATGLPVGAVWRDGENLKIVI
jgi:hypothetical protein